MPRPKKMEKTVQRGLPFEVMPEDMPPVDQPRKRGQKKKEVSPETGILPGDEAKTEQEPFPAQGGFVAVKDILFSAPIPIAVRPQFEEIGEIIRSVCKAGIDEEYYFLGLLLLEKLARKRPSPILAGKAPAWAAGILFALGKINFLFDKSSQPYISQDDLAGVCGVKKSSAADKGKLIRNMFNMSYWDSRFSTRRMQARNPLAGLVMTNNGFIVNINSLLRR